MFLAATALIEFSNFDQKKLCFPHTQQCKQLSICERFLVKRPPHAYEEAERALKKLIKLVTADQFAKIIASFLDQGLFLEMWAGVLQEAGDAYSRART